MIGCYLSFCTRAYGEIKNKDSDNSDDDIKDSDLTVLECPGLALTGEMEVKNPLFQMEEDYCKNVSPAILPKKAVAFNINNIQEAPFTPCLNQESTNRIISPEAAVPQSK